MTFMHFNSLEFIRMISERSFDNPSTPIAPERPGKSIPVKTMASP